VQLVERVVQPGLRERERLLVGLRMRGLTEVLLRVEQGGTADDAEDDERAE
jgi:hypothetical protein